MGDGEVARVGLGVTTVEIFVGVVTAEVRAVVAFSVVGGIIGVLLAGTELAIEPLVE